MAQEITELASQYGRALFELVDLIATKDLRNCTDCYKRYVGLRQKLFSLEHKMIWERQKSLVKEK